MSNFENFYRTINYQFKNEDLLREAITHPSLTQEKRAVFNYQRLEFLGDKVLSLIITEFLFHKFPNEMEGALSRRQAALVVGETLTKIAHDINLNEILLMSEGEERLGGRNNKRNLENALESLIGAIYLDANYNEAKKFVMKFWHDLFDSQDLDPPKDPVSHLQEIVQAKTKQLPEYHTVKSGGSSHAPEFTCVVKIPQSDLEFTSKGSSKKEAQKEAAKVALEFLEKTDF